MTGTTGSTTGKLKRVVFGTRGGASKRQTQPRCRCLPAGRKLFIPVSGRQSTAAGNRTGQGPELGDAGQDPCCHGIAQPSDAAGVGGESGGPSRTGGPAASPFHHVLFLEPGSKRERYDVVDYQFSDHRPSLTSSFSEGVHSGRWERSLKADDLALFIRGAATAQRSHSMCYLGPEVRRSPDVLLRVLGIATAGRPLAEHVQGLREDVTTLTPDAGGDGVVLQSKLKKADLRRPGTAETSSHVPAGAWYASGGSGRWGGGPTVPCGKHLGLGVGKAGRHRGSYQDLPACPCQGCGC